ncbi:rhodanese-like domain-containing protein [Fluviicola sp.]|jgi:rhodanese-related sulfurtransferase|uniref:rhodanese-like domain-containing protein n=1 Tax=Fluviicola sp. TaxID=1917219 RepID=UPI00283750A9|nr:rhodanese-like domain-containing protein [Fluviicola sp.]MDR0803343.1 rhodanese-like domain-containing protein [Fluviicola sp.]
MFESLRKLFGGSPKKSIEQLMSEGAVIVDVRSPGEYASGHIKKSINIPLQSLATGFNKLDRNKPVITCCASGMRSASAKSMLKSKGFVEVRNGGSWVSLRRYEGGL